MLRGLLAADLARDQDLRARAARRDRHASACRCCVFVVSAGCSGRGCARPRRTCRDVVGADLPIFASLLDRRRAPCCRCHDHRHLPRGRHPEAAARDAAAAAHDPGRARARQAAVHARSRLARCSLAGRRYYPVERRTCRSCRSRLALLFTHRQHPVARLPDRQRRAHGALRAADRRRSSSIRCSALSGLFVPVDVAAAGRCRRSPACCRSPTRCRCCGASGAARAGCRTSATSPCWRCRFVVAAALVWVLRLRRSTPGDVTACGSPAAEISSGRPVGVTEAQDRPDRAASFSYRDHRDESSAPVPLLMAPPLDGSSAGDGIETGMLSS